MKVKELIEKLKELDQEKEVWRMDEYRYGFETVKEVVNRKNVVVLKGGPNR